MGYGTFLSSALLALRQLWMRMHGNGRLPGCVAEHFDSHAVPDRPRQSFPLCLIA
jgi:hypothetical protein